MPNVQDFPSENSSKKVRSYLNKRFLQAGLKAGSKLPPVRGLAQELKVSTATVFSVYKDLAKEGLVEGGVGRGTFLKGGEQAVSPRQLCFALNRPLEQSASADASTALLLEGILNAASSASDRITVLPLGHSAMNERDIVKDLESELSRVDGLLFLPGRPMTHRLFHDVSALYEKNGKPVVCLNQPHPTAMANFVAPDHFESAYRLTSIWVNAGRKRILYVAAKNTLFTITNFSRPWGAQYALDRMGVEDVTLSTLHAETNSEESGFRAMDAFLRQKGEADAIFCFGDWVALGVIRALNSHGRSIPGEVSVMGSSGVDLEGSSRPGMSRAIQPARDIGERALHLLVQRIQHGNISFPGILLPIEFLGGDTTSSEENSEFKKL